MAYYPGEYTNAAYWDPQGLTTFQTGAIDDVYRTVNKTEEPEALAEGKKIIEQLVALKYEVEHDRKLTYEYS